MKYTLFLLTSSVWVILCVALLDAGLVRHFDPERDCDGSPAMSTVCNPE